MRSEELIYREVNPRQVGRLQAFRERSTPYSDVVSGLLYRTWSLGGEGEKAMVFLPGGMAHGEVWFPQMLHLRDTCRTVAISLPESKSMEQAADGVIELLLRMGILEAVFVGYSLGGILAQVIARRALAQSRLRVRGMCLVLTGAPAKGLDAQTIEKYKVRKKVARRSFLMSFAPGARILMAENAFEANCPEQLRPGLDFWRAFIEDTYCNFIYKKQYINLNYIAIPALYSPPSMTPDDLARWDGRVLIMESDGDKTFAESERAALRGLYPRAQVEKMDGIGQFALLTEEERVSGRLEQFWYECTGEKRPANQRQLSE